MTREEARTFLQKWLDETLDSVRCDHSAEWCEAIDMAISALSAEQSDLISRADAIERIKNRKEWCVKFGHSDFWKRLDYTEHFIKALPSAEAEPTVIRSKTLMPTKDFKEWAKRVKEENGEDVIVIPCDAELADRPTIVRCKDCKYKNAFSDCTNTYGIWDKQVADDDFCSRGERKGGADMKGGNE